MTGSRNPEASFRHLDQTLRFVADQIKKELHVSLPGIILAYDRDATMATVQPATDIILDDGTSMPRSQLVRVPVLQPYGGGFLIHVPVQPGDACTLLWADRSLQDFKTRRQCAAPPYPDIMPATDCVALLGWPPPALTPVGAADSLVLQHADGTVYVELTATGLRVRADMVEVDMGAAGAVVRVGADTSLELTPDGITLAGRNVTIRTDNYRQEAL